MEDDPMPKPTVDHQYWFDFSKKLLDGAIERRDDAADRLQKLVVWLWGIYTGAAAIGFTLAKNKLSPELTLLVGSASVALIGVYWITVWVRNPEIVVFDPRSPDDIEAAYEDLLKVKQTRLKWGLGLSLVAAALVATSLLVVSLPRNDNKIVLPTIAAQLGAVSGKRTIAVSTAIEPGVLVKISVLHGNENLVQEDLITSEDGTFQASLSLPTNDLEAADLRVRLDWNLPDNRSVGLTAPVAAAP
jgi:hypothetical protein